MEDVDQVPASLSGTDEPLQRGLLFEHYMPMPRCSADDSLGYSSAILRDGIDQACEVDKAGLRIFKPLLWPGPARSREWQSDPRLHVLAHPI